MRQSINKVLEENQIMVIDGSMGTALEALGCNLKTALWTAKALDVSPEKVYQVHMDYFKAGADCGITCSYQATIQGLMNNGYTEEQAEAMIIKSVEIFRKAREDWWEAEGKASGRSYPVCLAGIGSYGAYLADGSEYRGDYGVSDEVLYDFHKRRMELLWNAGADILLIETQPSLHEALIEAEIAEELGADYWVSFSCIDAAHTCAGDKISECAKVLSEGHEHLKMIGINCTAPALIEKLILELKKNTTLPIGVYPNSGEVYDAVTKTWQGSADGVSFGDYAYKWMAAGASAVGGCCQTVASHIEQVVEAREKYKEAKAAGKIKIAGR